MLLYFHTPFCVQKCKYCDFTSFVGKDDFVAPYFAAAKSELHEKACKYGKGRVTSIYFGGGTPTSVDASYLVEILKEIFALFDVSPDAEISIEANPATFDREKLLALKAAGFNRISVGVQSFFDDDLIKLGRIHNGAEAKSAVALAREVFDNVSIDLMIGIDGQTKERLKSNLDVAAKLNVNHVSAYMLIVEDGTPLKKLVESGKYSPVSEDDCAMLYDYASSYLNSLGFERYEVSNFAKGGAYSRHNMGYWEMKNYLGIGLSAHSLFGRRRFYNVSDIKEYIAAPNNELEEEILSDKDFEEEYVMLALRTKKGVELADYAARFNASFLDKYSEKLEKLAKFLDVTPSSVSIRGEFVSVGSAITAEVLSAQA